MHYRSGSTIKSPVRLPVLSFGGFWIFLDSTPTTATRHSGDLTLVPPLADAMSGSMRAPIAASALHLWRDDDRFDEDETGEVFRVLGGEGGGDGAAEGVSDDGEVAEGEAVEEGFEVVDEGLPVVARGGFVAVAVAAHVGGVDAVAERAVFRLGEGFGDGLPGAGEEACGVQQ